MKKEGSQNTYIYYQWEINRKRKFRRITRELELKYGTESRVVRDS